MKTMPDKIEIRGAKAHNLKNIDVDIPLGKIVGIATVIVIEHDLDVIRQADYLVDMGPGGGIQGGRIVATGAPAEVAANGGSITGKYL